MHGGFLQKNDIKISMNLQVHFVTVLKCFSSLLDLYLSYRGLTVIPSTPGTPEGPLSPKSPSDPGIPSLPDWPAGPWVGNGHQSKNKRQIR